MYWLPQCAPRRRAADESGARCVYARAASLRKASEQLSARDGSSDEQSAVSGEAAVLVSRRTALRTTHGLLGERLRDDGYLGPVPAKLMLVSLR